MAISRFFLYNTSYHIQLLPLRLIKILVIRLLVLLLKPLLLIFSKIFIVAYEQWNGFNGICLYFRVFKDIYHYKRIGKLLLCIELLSAAINAHLILFPDVGDECQVLGL